MQTREILSRIVENKNLHSCWLNSLSYLEYRGFRKIARSQTTETMSMEILFHTMEEVRHAVFFKKQAVKLGGNSFKNYSKETLLCESAIKSYFYELDQGVVRILGRENDECNSSRQCTQAAYSLVTWLIEERALAVYGEYESALRDASLDFSLSGILKEENGHLAEMIEASRRVLEQNGIGADSFLQLEEKCFLRMWEQIQYEVNFTHAQLQLL